MRDTSAEELVLRARRAGTDASAMELKAAVGALPKSVVETVSAFANGHGGTLLLGIGEEEGFAPARGFVPKVIQDALARACADDLTPPVRAPITLEEVEGSIVVRLDVPEMDPLDKPCFVTARGAHQGSFIRGGDGDRRLTGYEVGQLLANRRQPTDDAEPVLGASAQDLDPRSTAALLKRVRSRNRRAFSDVDDADALRRLGVTVLDPDGVAVPSVAGLLCLGRYPQQFFPQFFVSFVALPGLAMGDTTADGRRFLDNRTFDGPIGLMVEEAIAAVERNMRRAAVIRGVGRRDHYDFPLDVVRELIVNAVMHRDYGSGARGTQVQVELYPDRLVVKSPGGLYGGVEVGQLGIDDVSSSRNSVLAKLLADVPIGPDDVDVVCENRGSGLPRVVRALREAGMSPPEFDVTPAHVFVTVPQHALLDPDTVEWIAGLAVPGLSDEQHLALAMMRTSGSVTNEMLRAWGAASHSATEALRGLVSRGLAHKLGGRRYARYELGLQPGHDLELPFSLSAEAVGAIPAAPLTSVEAQQAAVVQAIRAGHVTSRDIQKVLGISYPSTMRRIRALREAGTIEETAARHSRAQSYRLTGRSTSARR